MRKSEESSHHSPTNDEDGVGNPQIGCIPRLINLVLGKILHTSVTITTQRVT